MSKLLVDFCIPSTRSRCDTWTFWLKNKIYKIYKNSHGPFSLNCVSSVQSAEPTPEWADLIQRKYHGHCIAIIISESYTSVSHLTNTEPSELLCLRRRELIASESVVVPSCFLQGISSTFLNMIESDVKYFCKGHKRKVMKHCVCDITLMSHHKYYDSLQLSRMRFYSLIRWISIPNHLESIFS